MSVADADGVFGKVMMMLTLSWMLLTHISHRQQASSVGRKKEKKARGDVVRGFRFCRWRGLKE